MQGKSSNLNLLESEMDGSPYGMEDDMDPEMMHDMGDMDDYD